MRKHPLTAVLLSCFVAGGVSFTQAQTVQWASQVIKFSSQYGTKQYSAAQALGKPDVLPTFQESPSAWSPLREESHVDEYLWVSFEKPMRVRQVMVGESYNPGAVARIYCYDAAGHENLVWQNPKPGPITDKGRLLSVKFPPTQYEVVSVKVVLNTQGWPGWKHIDCIGISDSETPYKPEINLVKGIRFDSKPENLGSAVNSRYDDILPVISPDGRTLYFDRKDHPMNLGGTMNDDIWVSRMGQSNIWTRAENLGAPLNNAGHNFLSAISPDGNTVLLGNIYEPDGNMKSGLSMSHRTVEGWSFPEPLTIDRYYNNSKFTEFHMGAEGRTIVVTLDREDSEGAKDIYVCFRKDDGTWTEPRNLGKQINSAGTELSPFLAADGRTLYFSTDGQSGYGGRDMYMSRRLDETWTNWSEPQNLGPAINSAGWEAYYSIPASGEYAYFASQNNTLGKTDIFRIRLAQEMRPGPVVLVKGKVLNGSTGKPIGTSIRIETLPSGELAGIARSNPVTGEYQIVLPAGQQYGFMAQADSFLSVTQNLDLTSITAYKEESQDLKLIPMVVGGTVALNNIFFGASDATIQPTSEPELQRVLAFLQSNENIRIEIAGHTNSACEAEFCQKLSAERAKAVFDYLSQHGIAPSRMAYTGYGSTRPIAPNSTPEGQKMNRRVEITITGM